MFPRDALMLGCAPLGGLYHRVFTEDDVRKVIREAILVHGIRHIDTAPWYGHGKSEEDLGNILHGADYHRSNDSSSSGSITVFLYTKVGRVIARRDECDPKDPHVAWGDTCYAIVPQNKDVVPVHDYTASGIARSVDGSLERLKLSRSSLTTKHDDDDEAKKKVTTGDTSITIKLAELRLHDAEDEERFQQATLSSASQTAGIDELLRQCSELGAAPSLGMNDPHFILRILRHYDNDSGTTMMTSRSSPPPPRRRSTFRSVLMAGNWNLMDQTGLGVMLFCEEKGVDVHNAGIFGAGLLWGATKYRYSNASDATLRRRDEWAAICRELGVSLPAAAFAFARLPRAVTKVAFGCTTVEELRGCVSAADESMAVPVVKLISLAANRRLLEPRVTEQCLVWAAAIGGSHHRCRI